MTIIRLAVGGGNVERIGLSDAQHQPGILVSYYFRKNFEKIKPEINYRDWVMDSGAYSAWNAGAIIDLKEFIEYCKFMKEFDPKLTEIFALDVIGDHVLSLKNTEAMWAEGIEAIPCYHIGEPWSALMHMAKNYPKIALGGVARMKGKQKLDWARKCMNAVWPKKVHGFGFGSEPCVMAAPFHSVDATSWSTRPQRFGQWQSLGLAAAKDSLPLRRNHQLQLEVAWYLELEQRAKHRWEKQLQELENL